MHGRSQNPTFNPQYQNQARLSWTLRRDIGLIKSSVPVEIGWGPQNILEAST
jgi:hypothetical protein